MDYKTEFDGADPLATDLDLSQVDHQVAACADLDLAHWAPRIGRYIWDFHRDFPLHFQPDFADSDKERTCYAGWYRVVVRQRLGEQLGIDLGFLDKLLVADLDDCTAFAVAIRIEFESRACSSR